MKKSNSWEPFLNLEIAKTKYKRWKWGKAKQITIMAFFDKNADITFLLGKMMTGAFLLNI